MSCPNYTIGEKKKKGKTYLAKELIRYSSGTAL